MDGYVAFYILLQGVSGIKTKWSKMIILDSLFTNFEKNNIFCGSLGSSKNWLEP